jgi:DDE superfamily endonuclease
VVGEMLEPSTKVKSNGRKYLLLYDGYNGHVSAQFVSVSIDYNIILFLLPPHSSYLLQPLDVGFFGPMKWTMASNFSRLYASDIACLEKPEWIEYYIKAGKEIMKLQNIFGGWRGAGLSPLKCIAC